MRLAFLRIQKRVAREMQGDMTARQRDITARTRIYEQSGILGKERGKGLVYLVEKRGLGRQFSELIQEKGASAEIIEMMKIKGIADPFLDFLKKSIDSREIVEALRNAGGEHFGTALRIAGGKNFGIALVWANGEHFGTALRIADGQRVGKALRIAGGERVGEHILRTISSPHRNDELIDFFNSLISSAERSTFPKGGGF